MLFVMYRIYYLLCTAYIIIPLIYSIWHILHNGSDMYCTYCIHIVYTMYSSTQALVNSSI
jgi:hypothetical protein